MIRSAKFCDTIYGQFNAGVEAGLNNLSLNLPVTSLRANRITLAAPKRHCAIAPHDLSLSRHPSGIIWAELRSPYGLACPDPLVVRDTDYITAARSFLPARNHASLLAVIAPPNVTVTGVGYDGQPQEICGLGEDYQKLFVAQLAGGVMRRVLQL